MATLIHETNPNNGYYVVHPLDDVPEEKCSAVGQIEMSGAVKASLLTLRGYLVLVIGLALYHFVTLATVAIHHTPH